ncbi:MAG: hypothetical protein C0407_18300, partial [Desulfobacca sp.]|nr:hypothetical protein [Desulfobacca sp.]
MLMGKNKPQKGSRNCFFDRSVLCLLLFLALPLFIAPPVQADNVIRFGASLSLTGRMATEGRRVRDGYDFYMKHINARGGIPIKG